MGGGAPVALPGCAYGGDAEPIAPAAIEFFYRKAGAGGYVAQGPFRGAVLQVAGHFHGVAFWVLDRFTLHRSMEHSDFEEASRFARVLTG